MIDLALMFLAGGYTVLAVIEHAQRRYWQAIASLFWVVVLAFVVFARALVTR